MISLVAGVRVGSPVGLFTLIMIGCGILFAWTANKYFDNKKKGNNHE
jgi:hypothetical protein